MVTRDDATAEQRPVAADEDARQRRATLPYDVLVDALETIPQSVFIAEPDGQILYFNEVCLRSLLFSSFLRFPFFSPTRLTRPYPVPLLPSQTFYRFVGHDPAYELSPDEWVSCVAFLFLLDLSVH
jgi:PAS domain-containing protein